MSGIWGIFHICTLYLKLAEGEKEKGLNSASMIMQAILLLFKLLKLEINGALQYVFCPQGGLH